MYERDDPNVRLTIVILELLDYQKEHFPLTLRNVETYARGTARYLEKIEKEFMNYYRNSDDSEEEKGKVARMIDAITKGTRTLIEDVYKDSTPKPF